MVRQSPKHSAAVAKKTPKGSTTKKKSKTAPKVPAASFVVRAVDTSNYIKARCDAATAAADAENRELRAQLEKARALSIVHQTTIKSLRKKKAKSNNISPQKVNKQVTASLVLLAVDHDVVCRQLVAARQTLDALQQRAKAHATATHTKCPNLLAPKGGRPRKQVRVMPEQLASSEMELQRVAMPLLWQAPFRLVAV